MLDLVRKGLRAGAVCAAAAVAVAGATPAYAQGSSTLTLPVEFNDFNADNVLFEYQLNGSSLNTLGTGQGRGLVEARLGANGMPVYTRNAVESAARAMAAELNSAWQATAPKGGAASLYAALQASYRTAGAKDEQLVDGDDAGTRTVSFEGDSAWKIVGASDAYVGEGSKLYKGAAPAWTQDNDGVLGYDPATPLARTYTSEELLGAGATTFAGHYVAFGMWNDAANAAGLTVAFSCGGKTSDAFEFDANGASEVEWLVPLDADGAELTVTVAPKAGATRKNPCRAAAVRVAASREAILGNGAVTWQQGQMGTESRDAEGNFDNLFYQNSWKAAGADGAELAYEGKNATAGSVAWEREGDGVIASETGTTIARTFDVAGGAVYRPLLWNAVPGMKIAFYAGDSTDATPLATIDAGAYTAGWVDGPFITVPAGATKLTVALTGGEAGAKIAALKLTSLGAASKLGSYDETVAKYADGSKKLSDATTCMDYVYCALNHLFDESSMSYNGQTLKVPVKRLYNAIELQQNEPAEDGGDAGYSFVADYAHSAQKSAIVKPDEVTLDGGYRDLVYDRATGTISNAPAGAGDDRAGFFPLDERADGQTFDSMFEDAAETAEPGKYSRAEKVAAMGAHNYHYSMVSHSSFTYDASKNQFFTFEGDDDTYLFINNQLVIDLGGAHTAQTQTVALEDECPQAPGRTWAQYLGLVDGNSYNFDFFYMERHTDYSDFAVTTNIVLARRSLGLEAKLATDQGDGFKEGDVLEFEVEVKNTGTDKVSNIELSSELAGAVVDYGKSGIGADGTFSLRAGQSKKVYVRYTVTRADVERGSLEAPFVASGVDGRDNEVTSNKGSVPVQMASVTPAPQPDGGKGDGSKENGTADGKTEYKTVYKTATGGLARTGDHVLFVATGVALLGGLIASLGITWSKRRQ